MGSRSRATLTNTKMMRIARLTYLNCAPFYWDCEHWGVPLIPCVPRELGQLAARGEVDAGPMAVVDWFGMENEFEPVGPYGIASDGAVLSVLLFSRRPIEMLQGALKEVVSLCDDPRAGVNGI